MNLSKDRDMFDLMGNLSQNGKSRFWRELNRVLRILDKDLHEKLDERKEQGETIDSSPMVHQRQTDFGRFSLEKAYQQFKRH